MVVNDKKNFLYKDNFGCKQYYTLSELNNLKNIVNLSIEKYIKNDLNDDIINHLNTENKKKSHTNFVYKENKKQGLYLISLGKDFVKIGISKDIERRMKEIKASNPGSIKLLFFIEDVYLLEKILHLEFDEYRINNEWFNYEESILDAFKIIKKNQKKLSIIECKDTLKLKLKSLKL